MDWPPHITVAAIAERDGRFLFVEEEIDGRRVLNQPAGHLDPDETLFEAVVRETLEETGWLVEPRLFTGIYHYPSALTGIVYHRVTFLVSPIRQTDHALDPVIRAVHWLTRAELAQFVPRSPIVEQCLDDYQRRGGFPLELVQHQRVAGGQ